jgi:signal transduction histidine kinase
VYLPDQVTPYPADQLPLARAIRGEFVNADEQFLRHAKAPHGVWLSVTGSPLMDESGMQRGGVVVFGDITDRKRAEEALRRAHDELEQRVRERTAELAMKHRDLETLLYVTSHDLREPLRSIENFSRLVHDRYADRLDEKGRDFLRRVVRGAKRMDKLLADILALSRAQRMETPAEEVDGHAIVQEVLRQLDHVIKKTGATVRVAPDLPKLRVNATWATHGVYNLIANALKFTRDGEAPEIEIASYQPKPDEKVVGLVVRDRGPGVSPEHAERIFQLFQRAVGREVEGTGAGLAIVRQVAERHGGRAWVQPREGGGSEFVLTFGPLGPAERKDIHL